MKRKILSLLYTVAGCIMLSGLASAQANISNTGPGSNNQVTITSSTTTNCTSTNDIQVTNTNQQGSSSGSSNTSGNTSGGNATSGSATNTNSTSTSVAASGCTLASSVTPEPETPGGSGAGEVLGESTEVAAVTVASLPATGELSDTQRLAATTAVLSGLILAGYGIKAWAAQKNGA